MSPETIISLIAQYRYPILVPTAFLAGLPVCMITGVLIRTGVLSLVPAYACVMSGELIGDVIWYWVGYHWGERFVRGVGKYVGVDGAHIAAAKKLFNRHNQRLLLASKLTTGLGFAIPILFTAGMARMSFRNYMIANVSGQFVWSGGLIAVGYFFGDYYLRVNSAFEKATAVSFFIMCMLLIMSFARYMGKRLTRD